MEGEFEQIITKLLLNTGLLIFRAVAEPRNSGKSAKSGEIHKNTQNTAKFDRNLVSATGGIYLP